MGREKMDAETCENSLRIELSYLLKSGLIQKDKRIMSSISWLSMV